MENLENFSTETNQKPGYSIKIENFEGPLDLLLYLIKKNEIDIYDIPIAQITKQYLEYIELMEVLDLDVAGEFIVMAATLMRIKAQLLLPKPKDQEESDPRQELVAALLEYKKFKEVSGILETREKQEMQYYPCSIYYGKDTHKVEVELTKVSLYDLLAVFKQALERTPRETFHEVNYPDITVDERIEHILNYLENQNKVLLEDLFKDNPIRLVAIVTFLAILELVRTKKILILQKKLFDPIWVEKS